MGKREQSIKVDNSSIACYKSLANVHFLYYTTIFFNNIGENKVLSASFPHFLFRVTSCHAHPVTSIERLLSVCAHDFRLSFLQGGVPAKDAVVIRDS